MQAEWVSAEGANAGFGLIVNCNMQGPANRHIRLGGVLVHLCLWAHPLQCPLSVQAIPGGAA